MEYKESRHSVRSYCSTAFDFHLTSLLSSLSSAMHYSHLWLLVLTSFQPCSAAPITPESLLGYSTDNHVIHASAVTYSLAPGQTEAADIGNYLDFNDNSSPQPIRGTAGGTDPGPRVVAYDQLNPDVLAPPGTDHGGVYNAAWSMAMSSVKMGEGRAGWSRQQNDANLPAATAMAGVDMRLEAGGYRELHWYEPYTFLQ